MDLYKYGICSDAREHNVWDTSYELPAGRRTGLICSFFINLPGKLVLLYVIAQTPRSSAAVQPECHHSVQTKCAWGINTAYSLPVQQTP